MEYYKTTDMKFLGLISSVLLLFVIHLTANQPIPYSGKISIRGVNYDGDAQFTFSLQTKDGKTRWRNGNKKDDSIKVRVRNGFYNVLLGGQGMNSLPPQLFLDYDELYLKVRFDNGDGKGLRHLEPDQRITATPRALVAEVAKVAKVAELVKDGVITRNMLSVDVLAKLDANQTASAISDGTITRNMLHANVLSDLSQPTPVSGSIKLSMLDSEVTAKLDQNGSGGAGVIAGSIISVPYGQSAPAGYSLYQRGEPKALVWEEKTPVSVARFAYDGVEVLDGKIYFVGGGGANNYAHNIAERYDPVTNTWETLASMSVARRAVACSVLNGKLYAIGGIGLSSVEIYDPSAESWTAGTSLPSEVKTGTAVTVNGKIYLIGGTNSSDQNINQVLCFDPSSNQWTAKASMPTARHGMKLVWFDNRIWAIGGNVGGAIKIVESYDPTTDTWKAEASLATASMWSVTWVTNGKIYVGGGQRIDSSIEVYDPTTKQWSDAGNLPEKKFCADAVVLNDQVYVVAGDTGISNFSNKVFAADLNASVESVYDLYRKDGDAPVGTPVVQSEYADGSVTGSKMADGAITTDKLNEQILKYLKPEITTQPQAQTVYADNNVSYSVTAEGKYLTYQWKKDGVDLTGETNATLNIIDANTTLHDGNYSVVVSNDFGNVVTDNIEIIISSSLLNGLVGWWKFDEGSGMVANDSSGNNNHAHFDGMPAWVSGKINVLYCDSMVMINRTSTNNNLNKYSRKCI